MKLSHVITFQYKWVTTCEQKKADGTWEKGWKEVHFYAHFSFVVFSFFEMNFANSIVFTTCCTNCIVSRQFSNKCHKSCLIIIFFPLFILKAIAAQTKCSATQLVELKMHWQTTEECMFLLRWLYFLRFYTRNQKADMMIFFAKWHHSTFLNALIFYSAYYYSNYSIVRNCDAKDRQSFTFFKKNKNKRSTASQWQALTVEIALTLIIFMKIFLEIYCSNGIVCVLLLLRLWNKSWLHLRKKYKIAPFKTTGCVCVLVCSWIC